MPQTTVESSTYSVRTWNKPESLNHDIDDDDDNSE
jgi:hypothetical protein